MGTSRRAAEHLGESPGGRPVHDVLVSVPLRHRLSAKLFGMTGLLALAALAALFMAERRMERELIDQAERSTALLTESIQATLRNAMEEASPSHAYAIMGQVGSLEGIDRVRVLDKQGRISFSTAPDDGTGTVDKQAGACAACHAHPRPLSRAPASARSAILPSAQGRVLSLVAPIYNARRCATAECHVHPQGRQVLGLLEVRVSLARMDADIQQFRRGFMLVLAAGIVLVAAGLYLFGRAEVLEPLAALVEGTRRIARDDLDVEIHVRTEGEMGLLASSFNEMTGSLRRLEDELNGMMQGLEQQVEARTADLRAAQEQLVRTEKLSSLGKLSASIAHEINNPLAGILTFAKLVSRVLAEGPPDDARRVTLQRNLALIERETQRCSAIVRNLLDFARERPIQPKPMDPRAAVDEALSLVANQLQTAGITLERNLEPVPEVLADFGQLRQAFVNIAMNGCEAMGSTGTLRVSSRAVDGKVEIAFADTGPGIPPERLAQIFDPFFTTKEKGTGLGLSVVYGIVERHGGKVEVQSAEGKGTTFTIRLPAVQADATQRPAGAPGSARAAS